MSVTKIIVRIRSVVFCFNGNDRLTALVSADKPEKRASHLEKNKLSVVRTRLVELEYEHQDLDEMISRFSLDPFQNQLQIKRMKKRKLNLKDQIERLRSQLIPDIDA